MWLGSYKIAVLRILLAVVPVADAVVVTPAAVVVTPAAVVVAPAAVVVVVVEGHLPSFFKKVYFELGLKRINLE